MAYELALQRGIRRVIPMKTGTGRYAIPVTWHGNLTEIKESLYAQYGDDVEFYHQYFYISDPFGDIDYSGIIVTTEEVATLVLLSLQ